MTEGDSRIVEWQVWDKYGTEPDIPDGLAVGGPWYPFVGAIHRMAIYRRPLVRVADARAPHWQLRPEVKS